MLKRFTNVAVVTFLSVLDGIFHISLVKYCSILRIETSKAVKECARPLNGPTKRFFISYEKAANLYI